MGAAGSIGPSTRRVERKRTIVSFCRLGAGFYRARKFVGSSLKQCACIHVYTCDIPQRSARKSALCAPNYTGLSGSSAHHTCVRAITRTRACARCRHFSLQNKTRSLRYNTDDPICILCCEHRHPRSRIYTTYSRNCMSTSANRPMRSRYLALELAERSIDTSA